MTYESRKAARQLERDVKKQRWAQRKLKKDAVLHLRVESDIMDRIKAEAAAQDMSVSDLVRCHLEERFSAPPISEGAPVFLRSTSAFSDVMVMRNGCCAVCSQVLPRGTNVRLALGPPPPERLVCGNCYDGLQSQFEDQPETSLGEK